MPVSWSYASPSVEAGAPSGTSAGRPYAYCRQLDSKTGDVIMNGATWAASPAPMLEVVLRVIRTPLGKYIPNAKFGVDYNLLSKILPTTAAAWRAEVIRALKPYVDLGLIANLAVTVDTSGNQGLAYQVEFIDVRARQKTSTGSLTI